MLVKVVDASAIGAVIFGEPEGPAIVRRLAGNRLVAPELIFFEIASICVKKLKRYPEYRQNILASFAMLKRLAMEPVEVQYSEVVLLAERHGLTAYDASYLWLAKQLGAELVTLDKELQRAWSAGI
ncbi:MAG: type II toxin-antitoxin system VapC family toxin [Deltaproteobacteria bacterium]|nr:type II toxin-antitoxin system VapC family toxin [Deltaproteobacteria bacterium]MBW1930695.1 type II toxin-antitoxin system VapC family toxin [Deltaproteobacteria bacterium]